MKHSHLRLNNKLLAPTIEHASLYDQSVDSAAKAAGNGWWHWQIVNIPVTVNYLPVGAGDASKNLAPGGSLQSINDSGKPGFGGACPPAGDKAHRYQFTVYALSVEKLN
ncbi:MAG: YbhB/YbcL family Raf kinase inhibitor-like protein [Gammaproteobacteria bacterium]